MKHYFGIAHQKALPLTLSCAGFFLMPRVQDVAREHATASPVAVEYINHALDLMQQHSINARKIDWSVMRKETMARAANAQTTYDTFGLPWEVSTTITAFCSWIRNCRGGKRSLVTVVV